MTDCGTLCDVALSILALAALGVVGVVGLRLMLEQTTGFDVLAYALPMGLGGYTFVLFILGWAGMTYRLPAMALAWILLVAALNFGRRLRRKAAEPGVEGTSLGPLSTSDIAPLASVGLLVLAASVSAIGRSYGAWDAAAIYAVKGYGMALEGTLLSASRWGSHGLTYPLNLPLGIMAFRLLGVEALPGSKLLFPVFYAAFLLAAWGVFRRMGASPIAMTACVVFLGTIPVVFDHASSGYVNLGFSFYLVFGCVEWIDGSLSSRRERVWLGGFLLAIAVWTRPEGILLVAVSIVSMEIGKRAAAPGTGLNLAAFLPFIVLVVTWVAFQVSVRAESEMGTAVRLALEALTRGEAHLDSLYRTNRYLIHRLVTPESWGLASVVILGGFLRVLANRKRRPDPAIAVMAIATFALWAGLVVFYFLVSFRGDLSMWLVTGGDRMFFPFVLLALLMSLAVLCRPVTLSRESEPSPA